MPIEPHGEQPPLETLRKIRPFSVTVLILGVLIITVVNLARFVLAIKYWTFLSSRMGISPLYITLTGLAWTGAGVFLLWGLWRAKTSAPRLMQAVSLTYALYYWLDQLFLKGHPVSGASGAVRVLLPINWQFSAGVTVVCLAYIAWSLGRLKVKQYFALAGAEEVKSEAGGDLE